MKHGPATRDRVLRGDAGFSLVELLVVLIIIGLLAAVAIAAFLNQQEKGRGVSAKSAAREAMTAMETYSVQNGGYNDADEAALFQLQPDLQNANLTVVSADTNEYELETRTNSSPQVTFNVRRNDDGMVERTCAPVAPSCPSGDW
jgi:type IV pilus assembly protein PilA